MSSSVQGKPDPRLRLASTEEALVIPENARPTDDCPTVISKTPPIVEPISSNKDKITELARRPASAESIVASLHGRRLAHYELIEPIGVGGMAAVIRARDTHLDRFVALKILPPEMAQQPDNIQRFHQEAKAAAKLDHENIARVFFCGEDQGLHFIAFEFVEGINLRTMLERRGRIPVVEAVRYILQVATGLEHAATRGVVHRDVKPSNIIITPDGRAKLVDMGLARNLERHGEVDLTQSGMTLGTFDYISPEQALEPRDADARSDIYSLGCTFYHALTGQSPAPEGTPAKKLHHHQHLAPLDPREIDPIIPDEIVMILSKMMQKNPKDRYQRPIHLVHHLVPLAKQLGVAGDMPEGLLVVDTALPSQPQTRPFLVIGLALVALVAVTLILNSLAPLAAPNTGKHLVNVVGGEVPDSKPSVKPGALPSKPDEAAANVRAPNVVSNIEDLHAVLNDRETKEIKATLSAGAPIDLDGIAYKGRSDQRLVLESEDAANNILRLKYENKPNNPSIGLILDGGEEVVFRKIQFQVDSPTTPTEGAVAAIAVRGVKTVRFENCIFSQPNAPRIPGPAVKRVPFASLLIDAQEDAEHARPVVILKECYFEGNSQNGGQVAVALNGPASLSVTDTWFRPHSAFFSFRDKCTRARTALTMEYSTGFVVTGPAFRFSKDAAADVRLTANAFTGSKGVTLSDGLPAPSLLYFAGDKTIHFEGRQNLYHSLNLFIEKQKQKPGEKLVARQDDFLKALAAMKCSDEGSTFLDGASSKSPLQNPGALADPSPLAFQLTADYAGRFGLRREPRSGEKLLEPVVAAKTPMPAPKTKIVDPDNAGLGFYSTLAAAISEAKDGETILIRHGKVREVVVKPCTLPKGIITIKADDGQYPILVLDESSRQRDLAMFTVEVGALQLHNLELRLDPAKAEDRIALSMVHLGESAQCAFKYCVLTLRRVKDVQLNVVAFTDLDMGTMMKTEPGAITIPRVEFHECFVRGKGDLISVRGCRPLQVEVEDSLIAIAGQLLDIEASNKPMSIDKAMMSWKMTRSSFFTTESAFSLRSKTGKGLAKTDVKLEGCLLAGLTPEEPIASLMLNDVREDTIGDYLTWESNKQNFYANFDKTRDWKELFPELNSEYDKLAFPKITDEVKQNLWDAVPGYFKATDAELGRLKGYGLQLTPEVEQRLLPTPDDEP
jgi:serine/threonine protein kinase